MKKKVNGKDIETCKEGKLLGLKIQSTGMVGHCANIKNKGNAVLTNLRRFRNLSPKVKTTLVKTLLIPILEYSPIPICLATLQQKINLLRVLNKELKFINCNEEKANTVEQLHSKFNISPLILELILELKRLGGL